MSFADLQGPIGASANWLRTQSRRYGFAFVAVCAAPIPSYVLSNGLDDRIARGFLARCCVDASASSHHNLVRHEVAWTLVRRRRN